MVWDSHGLDVGGACLQPETGDSDDAGEGEEKNEGLDDVLHGVSFIFHG